MNPADTPYRLCLVTDGGLAAGRSVRDLVARAVRGGVTMVQLREKTATTRAFLDEALALRRLLAGSGVPLIVNDRLDIALAAGADGVHVGQDDMPVGAVRRLVGPDVLIGLSITCGSDLDRPDATEADYLGIGPLFAQATKPDAAPPLGLAGFAALRQRTGKPVLAIGGLSAANARDAVAAGADGVAVVSAIMAATDPESAAAGLRRAIGAALQRV